MKQKLLNIYFRFIGFWARRYISRHKPQIIGITGSLGKTSCRMMIHQILKTYLPDKKVYTSPKNFNGELGMSISIFGIQDYVPSLLGTLRLILSVIYKSLFAPKIYDIVLLEYGIDHIGEMDFLLSIARPNIGIFTKVDKVHSLQFGSPDITASEKFKMIDASKEIIFLNKDDSYCLSYEGSKIDKFYYDTVGNLDADIGFVNADLLFDNGNIYTKFDILSKGKKVSTIKTNMIGTQNLGYISLGFNILEIYYHRFYKKSFWVNKQIDMDFDLIAGRFSILKGIKDNIIIDSSYNSTPLSMRKIIDTTYNIRNQLLRDHKIILCLGDMRELGEFTESEHRSLASSIYNVADYIFLVGPSMSEYTYDELIKMGFDENKMFNFSNSRLAGKGLKDFLDKSDERYMVLFKGGQNTIFTEEAIKPILADPEDRNKLTRQSQDWLSKKEKFFAKQNQK